MDSFMKYFDALYSIFSITEGVLKLTQILQKPEFIQRLSSCIYLLSVFTIISFTSGENRELSLSLRKLCYGPQVE